MNHENAPEPQPNPDWRKYRGEILPRGPQSEHVITRTLARLESLDAELRITEGYLNYGTPFAAFLRLNDIAAEDPTVIERFREVYADSWERMDQLLDNELDTLGWAEAITEFRKTNGIHTEFLDWNRPALEAHLHEVYSIVELDGWQHTFYR